MKIRADCSRQIRPTSKQISNILAGEGALLYKRHFPALLFHKRFTP